MIVGNMIKMIRTWVNLAKMWATKPRVGFGVGVFGTTDFMNNIDFIKNLDSKLDSTRSIQSKKPSTKPHIPLSILSVLSCAIVLLAFFGCAKYEVDSSQTSPSDSQSKDTQTTLVSKSSHSQSKKSPQSPASSAKISPSKEPSKDFTKAESTKKPKSTPQESKKSTQEHQKLDSSKNVQKNSKEPITPQVPAKTNAQESSQAPKATTQSSTNPPKSIPNPKTLSTLPPPLPLQLSYNELAKSSPRSDGNAILHLKKENEKGHQLIHIYDENGAILASLSFKNRQLDGISRIYKNGEVVKEVPYREGVLEGEVISILRSTRTTQAYKNSKKEGASITYRNGAIIAKKHYKNDILNGENLFFDAQNIAIKTTYINGKKNGSSSGYARDNLVFLQNYVDDFLSGEAKTYGQNAILKISRFYKDGVLDGEEIVYDYPSQKPLHKSLHKNGVLSSPYQNYDKEQVYESIKPLDFANALSNDPPQGARETWRYPSGQIAFVKNANKISTYHPNGTLASEFEISASGASGSTYNQNGVLESKVAYSRDSHIQWLYNADGKTLRTKNEKQRGKNILQTYKNGSLHKEIITIEGEDLTIYRVFFGGGGSPKIQSELYEKDKKVVGGKRYEPNGRVVFSYTFRSEDILFDEIFIYGAQERRAKILR